MKLLLTKQIEINENVKDNSAKTAERHQPYHVVKTGPLKVVRESVDIRKSITLIVPNVRNADDINFQFSFSEN